jgi:hypothetical protein
VAHAVVLTFARTFGIKVKIKVNVKGDGQSLP